MKQKIDFIKQIRKMAKEKQGKIVLPEAMEDERVKSACRYILKNKLSKIIVFGEEDEFDEEFVKNPECEIINIKKFPRLKEFANELFKLRQHKGMTLDEAKKLVKRADYFAMMLLHFNLASGVVAGASWTTADTLRPALQIIKTAPNTQIVSGATILYKPNCKPLLFADVSLNINPSAEELSCIAINSAKFYNMLVGKPRVAMLSFSTKGSSKGEMVEKVSKATVLAKANSNFLIEGEMQADAALDPKTAKQKGITSEVGGRANVFIFPDLNSGNIAYKLVSRLAGYKAVGPIMLGLKKPVNDLSRGCTMQEIVDTVCITKLMQ